MEDLLNEILWDGEELRWSGRPTPFVLLDETFRSDILFTWGLSFLILFVTVILMGFAVMAGTHKVGDVLILGAIALYLPAILSIRPLLDKKALENETLYAITNRRVISIVNNDPMYIMLDKGVKAFVEQKKYNIGNLSFGDAVGRPPKKSRALAVVGLREPGKQNAMNGLLFYNVEDPEQVLTYFA